MTVKRAYKSVYLLTNALVANSAPPNLAVGLSIQPTLAHLYGNLTNPNLAQQLEAPVVNANNTELNAPTSEIKHSNEVQQRISHV